MRTVEEILTRISKARYFSVLDAKSSFWQIPLEINSSYYTTFNSPFGRFRFLRMPFGISSGSEVCQQAMEHLFTGYPCEIIMDDLLVWGETQEEHDMNLRKVFARASEIGLKLNPSKCKFRLPEVGYIGHVLTSEGLKPDPEKTQAIIDIPPPGDITALQRFIGMVTYLAKFVPNLSGEAAPLRELLKNDTEWNWQSPQQKAFEKIKMLIAKPPVLWCEKICDFDSRCFKRWFRCCMFAGWSAYSVCIQSIDSSRSQLGSNRKRTTCRSICLHSVSWLCLRPKSKSRDRS